MFLSNVVVGGLPTDLRTQSTSDETPGPVVGDRCSFGLPPAASIQRSSEPRLLVRNERDHLVGAGRWTGSDARISSAAEATHSPDLVPAFSAKLQRGREQADAVAVSTNRGKACAWSPMGWPGRRGRETRMRSSGRPGPRDRKRGKGLALVLVAWSHNALVSPAAAGQRKGSSASTTGRACMRPRNSPRACYHMTPEAVTPPRLPLPAKRSSLIDTAAWATKPKH